MNKKILIVFNPNAGKGLGRKHANNIKKALSFSSFEVELFESKSIEYMNNFFATLHNKSEFFCVVVIGGDGTIGPCAESLIANKIECHLAAYGRGTANDFATFYKTQTSAKKFAKLLMQKSFCKHDTIKVNDKTAISVVCGGAFTNGVTSYNKKAKKIFGKVAYYAKAIRTFFSIPVQNATFEIDGQTQTHNIFMFLAGITQNAGGIKKIAKEASPNDGEMDLVIVKKTNFWGKLSLALSLFFGTLYKNKNVVYIKCKQFSVHTNGSVAKTFSICDIDGNAGFAYPICAVCKNQTISVLSGRKEHNFDNNPIVL